jgi:hypothetical protein
MRASNPDFQGLDEPADCAAADQAIKRSGARLSVERLLLGGVQSVAPAGSHTDVPHREDKWR